MESEPVVLLQLVEQREGVELDHCVLRARRLLDLVHPAAHDLFHVRSAKINDFVDIFYHEKLTNFRVSVW